MLINEQILIKILKYLINLITCKDCLCNNLDKYGDCGVPDCRHYHHIFSPAKKKEWEFKKKNETK